MARTSLAERVRALRREKGAAMGRKLGVSEAADAIGISRGFLSGIENGLDMPGRGTLIAIANYYGVSTDWLGTGEGNPKPGAVQERTARLISLFEGLDEFDKSSIEAIAENMARRPH